MDDTPPPPSKRAAARAVKEMREQRLKAALKVNIARRKAQAKARAADGEEADQNETG